MLSAVFLSAALLVAADAPAAQTGQTEQAPAATNTKADKERLVCRKEHDVGSHRPRKICMTKAEWEELEDNARRAQNRSNATQDLSRIAPK
ncbi:MAG TPA: hypothetical protein VD929_02220 [Caulobacteraceae bacterium]|nr:hypothetical protein [Caulobacteraceae bacterium]